MMLLVRSLMVAAALLGVGVARGDGAPQPPPRACEATRAELRAVIAENREAFTSEHAAALDRLHLDLARARVAADPRLTPKERAVLAAALEDAQRSSDLARAGPGCRCAAAEGHR